MKLIDLLHEELSRSNTITLWHYSRINKPTFILDPKRFGESSWSRRESASSDVPRIFFYTNPKQKEIMFDEEYTLYQAQVPSMEIYDLSTDPLDLRSEYGNNLHELLEYLSGWERTSGGWKKKKGKFKGVKYSVDSFEAVIWFAPIKVTRVEK